jgi:uncharacterized protein
MSGHLTADDVRKFLELEPNATCGFVKLTFVSPQALAAGALPAPFADARPVGSALYFMVTPEAPVRLHRIRNDQLYHYYLGEPLELFLLHPSGKSERVVIGPDIAAGQRVQFLIPGGTFHTARLLGQKLAQAGLAQAGPAQARWFLGASTEWPGVIPADVEIGNLDTLAAEYPAITAELRAIAASVREVAQGEIALYGINCRSSILIEHDLFGKPVSTLGSSPRACFSGSYSNRQRALA